MYLSKTDFLEYLQCPKCLWLKKKRPNLYVAKEPTEFDKKNQKEGQDVECLARELFQNGILLSGEIKDLLNDTVQLIAQNKSPLFQASFITERKCLAKVDILEFNPNSQQWNIYEVKSSTKIKTDRGHNHIKDVTFQKLVLDEAGIPVGRVFIIHLNKDYIRNGELNIEELFMPTDITDDVNRAYDITVTEVDQALGLLRKADIDMDSCPCINLTRSNHCSSFRVFNPVVPEYSVHDILRIRPEKIRSLIDSGIVSVSDISNSFELTEIQRIQVNLEKSQKALIDQEGIGQALMGLEYPLYFIDFETYMAAIPIIDGLSPHQHMPFQVSIHKLDLDGNLTHLEYLAENVDSAMPGLISFMKKTIPQKGSIVSWHKSFENSRNKEMAELYPEYSQFLHNLNSRTFDLEPIFKKYYLQPGFRGRSSIKRVLPVLLPQFSYENLDIQDGTEAMVNWRKMIFDDLSDSECDKIKGALLEYCKMDTLAMVEIFKHIKSI
jgi:CRISPR/Cas system-associated exonuclease Cas4 (RecB family)